MLSYTHAELTRALEVQSLGILEKEQCTEEAVRQRPRHMEYNCDPGWLCEASLTINQDEIMFIA